MYPGHLDACPCMRCVEWRKPEPKPYLRPVVRGDAARERRAYYCGMASAYGYAMIVWATQEYQSHGASWWFWYHVAAVVVSSVGSVWFMPSKSGAV